MERIAIGSPIIGVIGRGIRQPELTAVAEEVGREIARKGAVLVCGGLGGVMTEAARGAKEIGGITLGILPGPTTGDANEFIDFPIATNMGAARNSIIVHTADVLIAIGGGYGTLSEIALALKLGKGVVALQPTYQIAGVILAHTPVGAVDEALTLVELGRTPPIITESES
ncbi:MAG: TIGR00725 family protein [Syntrophobacteraceae bacterium]|nr:TIGR00725 family protein [Syntrophobacteraceae bacterium]